MEFQKFAETFYKHFIDMVDRILPTMPPSVQTIFVQVFARTYAVGEETCSLSYQDYANLTNLSVKGVRNALTYLEDRGIIIPVTQGSRKAPKTYRIYWPKELTNVSRYARDTKVLLRDLGAQDYGNILERLSSEDKEALYFVKESLPPDELAALKMQARKLLREGENEDDKLLELIFLKKIGPAIRQKYEQ